MYDINDVAKYFLTKKSTTNKNLQQLVYYAYAWVLTLLNIKLFNNRIEAWLHGPAIPDIYAIYKEYGWDNIPLIDEFDESIFTDDILDVFEAVIDTYGDIDTDDLESVMRRELPWLKARKDYKIFDSGCTNQLSDEDIKTYYKELYEENQRNENK